MNHNQTDPRVLRTRKLILEAFMKISERKDFEDISIIDLTTEAQVNRATFYRHFQDKYDLLEKALLEIVHVKLPTDYFLTENLEEKSLLELFTAVTEFQNTISLRCHDGYEERIAKIIRQQLEVILLKQLIKSGRLADEKSRQSVAAFLSWGLYGASVDWRKRKQRISPEDYIKPLLPYLLSGISQ
jgi:AcrR family transcriptional regulator